MNNINIEKYKATKDFKISENETFEDFGKSDKELKKDLSKVRRELGEFQDTIYAHGKYSILVCLQGMDTAGKDSLIREVFKDFNVSGVEVHSFKVPTELELSHNYLWRHYLVLPAKGKFGVFNRTHYENVLVTRVHPEYILNEHIPGIHTVEDIDQKFWDKRFEQINDFERHLAENGTLIFKFFLNLSKEEQRQRLLRRLAIKEKHWKFSPGDLKERKLWSVYQKCYEEAISKTTHEHAPWFAVPADNKKATRVIVANILLQSLKKYKDIKEPMLSEKIMANLDSYEEQLQSEQ
ncbi:MULTISPECIES: PPK2 family polyphosphate kinase [Maribacter]|uniref:Polyphosphate:nucleotide phosphotransferase, PPK2 family n=1 Tax=Maribacter dokdonensis TaxID=320912 RepID=A0ABY0UM93_9FLAO|nr:MULTISPECIES: PPK2 family polyphosphate kinase [Maribacter]HAF75836.1 phosphate--nucleotide phosphotransferase [Maribacter sp.]KSA14640.1 Polyphosphate:nucleotide phosphotransferase, PPK2 family [Maribacter dokdonensis DSW-8]PHN93978.1 phosphate--nucleotide phosphotransferase [Maribacter sp. 6B07]CAG2531430.1 PPK2 family [Maribacter dokdonensis]SDS89657.1 polyphosphate:nucleotide phosphotransferase, PPK2 family [Maribacter dokdonensis]|tara:strand:- start:110181 stop:111062 length:882 start_codon:yes stop_codon:yes gene_type:complete